MTVTNRRINSEWVIDSGCSFHMCPNEHLFRNLKKFDGGSMLSGNDQSCRVREWFY